jgi:N-acetylneuraminic acid mutarotase
MRVGTRIRATRLAVGIALLFASFQVLTGQPGKIPQTPDCTGDTWTPVSTDNAPSPRASHTAVWTGSLMIVWGGNTGQGYWNNGGIYNPITDSWTPVTTANAPTARSRHTAVWTGSDMIVWGGYIAAAPGVANTGGRYNANQDAWTATSTVNVPQARVVHTAVWTGSKMIVWGGYSPNISFDFFNTGGRYDPTTDTWAATSLVNAPMARVNHTAVWTGSRMIVWGGYVTSVDVTNTGSSYDPDTDTWTPISTAGAPAPRSGHSAVWTGSEMIVWGGYNPSGTRFNDGGRYNPITGTWTPISTTDAPAARGNHTAVWTGGEMIVWGGDPNPLFNTGGRYSRFSDDWLSTATTNAPSGRDSHTAIWTGSDMIVWGGYNNDNGVLNDGARYCALLAPQSAASRKTHGVVGAFDVDLPLTGTPGIECRTNSATNDHTMVVTFPRAVFVNGSPQAAVTSGTGTVGSDGEPNGGMVFVSGNTVTVPLTLVANAQTINVTLYSINGVNNVVIPMSVLAGDVAVNGVVNASDVSLTKSRIGQQINATNFRADVNAGGAINASDVSLVKSYLGTGLP